MKTTVYALRTGQHLAYYSKQHQFWRFWDNGEKRWRSFLGSYSSMLEKFENWIIVNSGYKIIVNNFKEKA